MQNFHLVVDLHTGTLTDVSTGNIMHGSSGTNAVPRVQAVQNDDYPYHNLLCKFSSPVQPLNGRNFPQHQLKQHIITSGPPSHSKCLCLATKQLQAVKALVSYAPQTVIGPRPSTLSQRNNGDGAPVVITNISTSRLYPTGTLCHIYRRSCRNSQAAPYFPGLIWCGLAPKTL